MTLLLYMKDVESNYIKEFDAQVIFCGDNFIVLDRSAFYPKGGGQDCDVGKFVWIDGSTIVKEVIKKNEVMHFIEGSIPNIGTKVRGNIDWERRYSHMRFHTSQHIISGVVFDNFHARTIGNQVHTGHSRVDFSPIKLSKNDLVRIENECNAIISKNISIQIYEEDRSELEKQVDKQRANLDLIPQAIKRLRIVRINDFDICPCAGTHVKNTSEIGRMKILKNERKGKDRERIEYDLV